MFIKTSHKYIYITFCIYLLGILLAYNNIYIHLITNFRS